MAQVKITKALDINSQCTFTESNTIFGKETPRTIQFKEVQSLLYSRYEKAVGSGASMIQSQALYNQVTEAVAFCKTPPYYNLELRSVISRKLGISKLSVRCRSLFINSEYSTICTSNERNADAFLRDRFLIESTN